MFKKVLKKSAQKSAQIKKCPKKYSGEDVQVDHGDGDGDGDGVVFFNTEKVSLKVAVIKETRQLLPKLSHYLHHCGHGLYQNIIIVFCCCYCCFCIYKNVTKIITQFGESPNKVTNIIIIIIRSLFPISYCLVPSIKWEDLTTNTRYTGDKFDS